MFSGLLKVFLVLEIFALSLILHDRDFRVQLTTSAQGINNTEELWRINVRTPYHFGRHKQLPGSWEKKFDSFYFTHQKLSICDELNGL
jgi:hypothetical protein